MSNRSLKRAYRSARAAADAVMKTIPAKVPPLWRRALSILGIKGPMSRFLAREEAIRAAAYRLALKRTARKIHAKEGADAE